MMKIKVNAMHSIQQQPRLAQPFRTSRYRPRTQTRDVRGHAGLFGFLGGGKAGGKSTQVVDELLEVLNTSAAKEEVSDLISQLRQYRPRSPTKSPLFWGDFEVLYSTLPNATGGPLLGSAPGKAVFGSQKPRQSLQPTGELVQSIEFKTLGIFPAKRSQEGSIEVLGGNRYEVQLSQKGEDVRRRFEVLYLDERVRVAQFLSDEEQEPVYFVFKRVEEEATEQDEEADSQLPAKVKPQKGTRKLESRKAKTSEEDEQVAGLTAALQEWQDKSKSSASLLREKERSSSSSRRSAEPAKANLLKLQTEVSELNQQLAEAVQAAEAAEGRYRQARAQLRESEKALR